MIGIANIGRFRSKTLRTLDISEEYIELIKYIKNIPVKSIIAVLRVINISNLELNFPEKNQYKEGIIIAKLES